jgi:predicted small secreted protein
MKLKRVLIGLGIGIAGGLYLQKKLSSQYIPAEKALKTIKPVFLSYGNVTGTWIHSEPKWVNLPEYEGDIYEGGFTVVEADNQTSNYSFIINAINGELITAQLV